jgi:hypothetical protein
VYSAITAGACTPEKPHAQSICRVLQPFGPLGAITLWFVRWDLRRRSTAGFEDPVLPSSRPLETPDRGSVGVAGQHDPDVEISGEDIQLLTRPTLHAVRVAERIDARMVDQAR